MTEPTGRREASKQAVRAALTAAANRLFAERGFEATTVRDIAAAANVNERTFYRYFEGKEGLLAEDYRAWLSALAAAIRNRPGHEPPLDAIKHAMLATIRKDGGEVVPVPVWLFRDRPLADLRQVGTRPLLSLETALTDATLARLNATAGGRADPGDPPVEYRAQVIARVAVAAMRSAIIHRREQRGRGEDSSGAGELLTQAFTILGHEARQRTD